MAALLLAAATTAAAAAAAARAPPSPAPVHVVPAAPRGLSCGASSSTSTTVDWGPPAQQQQQQGQWGAIVHHLYDLEVGRTVEKAVSLPFASVTVPGTATSATIGELQPQTAYFFKLRVHCSTSGLAGCAGGDAQMISGWSNFSSVISCSTTAAGDDGGAIGPPVTQPARDPAPLVETFWLEAYRVTENFQTMPDFLANHNSGDLDGDIAFLSHEGGTGRSHFFDFMSSPRVKYCVEIAKVDLTGKIDRTSSYPPFIPQDERFSDYASCNGFGRGGAPDAPGPADPLEWQNYTCSCDNHIDRTFAHQTKAQLCKYCGSCGGGGGGGGGGHHHHGGMQCNCSDSSLAMSARYVGYMPFVLPTPSGFGPPPPPAPGPSVKPYQFGGWYHFPARTKCPDDGTPVGTDGCTWRRDPHAQMVFGQDLLESGWNATAAVGKVGDQIIANNKRAMQAAFTRITKRSCGAAPSVTAQL
jgi:hypothetical protein